MKIVFIIAILASHLYGLSSYGYSLQPGWHAIKSHFDDVNVSSISDTVDIILSYKNNQWYGLSPNRKYTTWLEEKEIATLHTLDRGEAFWIFTAKRTEIHLTGEEVEREGRELHIKMGWNLIAVQGNARKFIPDYYLNKPQIKSVWHRDDSTKIWNVYSPDNSIMSDVTNDDNLSKLEYMGGDDVYWIHSSEDINISIIDYPLFFKDEESSYTIDEKDMPSFGIDLDDPNGDNIITTISGEDADKFIVSNFGKSVRFKDTSSKPKEEFYITVNATDGTSNISRDISISVKLRYENDYRGSYANNVGYDNSEHVEKQWYLDKEYLNIHEVHKRYNGNSDNQPIIQVVEGGFDTEHEDLIANMDFSMAYDASLNKEGNCTIKNKSHGTSSAGIIAARGYNGIGIRGIVPFAKLTGFKFREGYNGSLNTSGDPDPIGLAWAYGPRANEIDISSNSWGHCALESLKYEQYLKYGSEHLRDGKGRIYVIAAGNHRQEESDCSKNSTNLNLTLNSPYPIVVAAMHKNDKIYNLSTPGANVFVSAYGADIIWTTSTSSLKYASFGATSAAAPMVSGGIGLLLEACPSLSYRDVKNIIAKTAIQVDAMSDTWVKNGANINYSTDYGFGKLNVLGAIEMCQSNYIPLETQKTFDTIESVDEVIPHNGETIEIAIDVNESMKVEWVAFYLEGNIDNIGEYEFSLVSPAGAEIQLIHGNNYFRNNSLNSDNYSIENLYNSQVFRLSTVGFLDEESYGVWKIRVFDKNSQNEQLNRKILKVRFQILGF